MKKKIGYTLLAIFLIFIGRRIYTQMSFEGTGQDVFSLEMVRPPLPEDTAIETLMKIGSSIETEHFNDHGRGSVFELTTEERHIFVMENQEVLLALQSWIELGDPMLAKTVSGKHSRFFWPDYKDNDRPWPSATQFKKLWKLRLASVLLAIDEERKDEAIQGVRDLLKLNSLMRKNPTLLSLMVSVTLYHDSAILLTHFVPDSYLTDDILDQLPSSSELRNCMKQAIWIESWLISKSVVHMNEELGAIKAFFLEAWGGFHQEHTLNMIFDIYQWRVQQLDGPLYAPIAPPQPKRGNLFLGFNEVGKILVAVAEPSFTEFYQKVGIVGAELDITREMVKTRLAGQVWDASMMAPHENPLTLEPFIITEEGLVQILDANDPLWPDSYYLSHFWVKGTVKPTSQNLLE